MKLFGIHFGAETQAQKCTRLYREALSSRFTPDFDEYYSDLLLQLEDVASFYAKNQTPVVVPERHADTLKEALLQDGFYVECDGDKTHLKVRWPK